MQLQLMKNNAIPNNVAHMEVANVSSHTTIQFFAEILPVPATVIAKFNNLTAHDLVYNPDEVKILIDEKHYAFSKRSNMRHAPNLESHNNEQLVIDESTHLMKCCINHHFSK